MRIRFTLYVFLGLGGSAEPSIGSFIQIIGTYYSRFAPIGGGEKYIRTVCDVIFGKVVVPEF